MIRIFKWNSVLLKYYDNVYKTIVLYKLSVLPCFLDEDYIFVEEKTKEKIEDDWSEINIYDDYLK
jgi:hypothetical protein